MRSFRCGALGTLDALMALTRNGFTPMSVDAKVEIQANDVRSSPDKDIHGPCH
jgi:hypothetical protein